MKLKTLAIAFSTLSLLLIVMPRASAQASNSWNLLPNAFETGDIDGQNGWVNEDGSPSDDDIKKGVLNGVNNNEPVFIVEDSNAWTDYWNRDLIDLNEYGNSVIFTISTGAQTNIGVSHEFNIYYASSTSNIGVCTASWLTDDNSERTSSIDVSGASSVSLGFYASSSPVTFNFELNFLTHQCRVYNESVSTSWGAFSNVENLPITQMRLELFPSNETSGGGYDSFINLFYLSNTLNTSNTNIFNCTTCTRIITTDPTENQIIATSSSYFASVDYYVSPSDYILNNTYITYQIQSLLNDYQIETTAENYGETVNNTGTSTASFNLNLAIAGTYTVKVNIYTLSDPPWYLFWQDQTRTPLIQEYIYNFHSGSETTQADIDLAIAQQQARMEERPDTLALQAKAQLDQALNTFLYMPPIGYGTIIYNAFATTTATTSIAMTYTIAEGFPGEGLTLTLNASDAIANAISQIDSEVVATIDGSPFDEFMYYWNLLWYGALVLWIFKQVFGMFQLDITEEHSWSKPEEYQKSGNIKIQNRNNYTSNPGKFKKRTYMKRSQYSKYDR